MTSRTCGAKSGRPSGHSSDRRPGGRARPHGRRMLHQGLLLRRRRGCPSVTSIDVVTTSIDVVVTPTNVTELRALAQPASAIERQLAGVHGHADDGVDTLTVELVDL